MPKAVPIKKIACAFRIGISLAYGKQLRESKREVLFDLLDDMAVALTTYGIEEKNKRIRALSDVLGELGDLMDLPFPGQQRKKRR